MDLSRCTCFPLWWHRLIQSLFHPAHSSNASNAPATTSGEIHCCSIAPIDRGEEVSTDVHRNQSRLSLLFFSFSFSLSLFAVCLLNVNESHFENKRVKYASNKRCDSLYFFFFHYFLFDWRQRIMQTKRFQFSFLLVFSYNRFNEF